MWAIADLPQLQSALATFAQSTSAVPVALDGFGAFAPRVIYIHVCQTPELLALQGLLLRYLEDTLNLIDPIAKTRPFTPHLTVGFRDLTRSNFQAAWAEFQAQAVQFQFMVQSLTLLVHDGQCWRVQQDFPLAPSQPNAGKR